MNQEVSRVYWRSKEGRAAPKEAQYYLQPFAEKPSLFLAREIDSLPPPSDPIFPLERIDEPNREEWRLMVQKALDQIESGALQKVVLARKTTLLLPDVLDPFRLLSALQRKAQGASLFCFEKEGAAFLGASPERLFRREGNRIFVDVLAGTKKKGEAFSEKEYREFEFVQTYLRTLKFCEEMSFSTPTVHQTTTVQHLFSQGIGILKPGVSDLDILKALHPTPALCGLPQKTAFEWIRFAEPFARGFYGGVLGWQERDVSDWTVCIRSCLLQGAKVCLFTGAGIVAGSDPDAEWEELEAKLSLYNEIFTLGEIVCSH